MSFDDDFKIDPTAKVQIPLVKKFDNKGNAFYIGKMQLSAFFDLRAGNSMMVFTSEEGAEEIQMSPMDPSKRSRNKKDIITQRYADNGSRIIIPLEKRQDSNKQNYFVGEWHGIGLISARKGLFFTVFTSVEGKEVIQITELKHKEDENYDD